MSLTAAAVSLAGRSAHRRGRGRRLVERNARVYKRTWMIIVSGFFEPLFYLLSIGIGVGSLVGDVTSADGATVDYRTYVAPALLAASAFNGAVFDSTMNVFGKLRHEKVYDAVLATPLGVRDVAVGEITWALIRGLLYSATFMVVMAALGLFESWWGLLALPVCSLIGFAFAAVGMAGTSFMRSWSDVEFVTISQLVLFLFSATFYPLEVYPRWLEIVVQCTPLYHGVRLTRSLVLGDLRADLLLSVAYLVAMGVAGLAVATRRLTVLLTP